MDIFEIQGLIVRPTPEILLVKEFADIWERDNSKTKAVALQEFAYITFMVSQKKNNPYKGYDDSLREKKIIEGVIKEKGWKPDKVVKAAMKWLQEWQKKASVSYRYYMANRAAVEKTINYLETGIDYDERNKSGMPVHKFTDVSRGVKEADQVLKSLKNLETKVEEELYEASKTRGGKTINEYER